jgi:hypothetical protein
MSDIIRLHDMFTFMSDDGCRSSWIDKVWCSTAVDQLAEVFVMHTVIISDHRPLVCKLKCGVTEIVTLSDSRFDCEGFIACPQWHLCDEYVLNKFQFTLDSLLKNVHCLCEMFCLRDDPGGCCEMIDKFYSDIMQ